LITRNLRDQVTWWNLLDQGQVGGRKTWAPPVTIRGRWEESITRSMPGTTESVTTSTSVGVDRDVKAGDRLFRGISPEQDPELLEGTYPIKNFTKVPHLYVAGAFDRRAVL
jgi:hypothetical protein